MPTVSVVIPLFNKEREIERAIRSVLAQTIRDFELIVVNDGSTDGGLKRVRAFTDKRLRLIEQVNQGVSVARNRGIEAAKSHLIAFLDADDEWASDFLETILRLRNQCPSCEVYATNYYVCGNHYKKPAIIRGLPRHFKEGLLQNYFTIAAQSDPPLWTSAVAVTKRAISTIHGFPVGIAAGEDLLTWARLAASYNIAYSSQTKAYFYAPGSVDDRPGRNPQTPDIVGQELMLLKQEGTPERVKDLNKYLSLWHKMRANIFMQLDKNVEARRELKKALKYSNHFKLYALYWMALLPGTYASVLSNSIKKTIRKVI